MRFDYYSAITKISDKYSEPGGYAKLSELWENEDFRNKLGDRFGIVFQVVDGFLSACNSRADSRVFGMFSREQIKGLANRCEELENASKPFR